MTQPTEDIDGGVALAEANPRAYVEHAPHGIIVVDARGNYLDANPAACAMVGYTRDELLQLSLADTVAQKDAKRALDRFLELKREGHICSQALFQRKDGSHVLLSLDAVTLPDERYMAFCSDVTAQNRARQSLRESERRFSTAFEFAATGMALVAPDGAFLRVNSATCELLGYSSEELLATNFQSLTHPEDRGIGIPEMQTMIAGELEAAQVEKRYIHKNGQSVWAALSISLVRGVDGAPLHFVAQIQDISKRKRTEAALLRSEHNLHKAQALARLGNFVWNLASDTLVWSPEMFRVYGISKDEAPSIDRVTALVHPADRAKLQAAFTAAFAGHPPRMVSYRIRRPDGEERWVLAQAEAKFSPDGTLEQVFGTAQDITERKHAEQERRKLEARVQQAQKLDSLGVLAGGIAHDFNNMLVSILGNAGLALMDLTPESPARPAVEAIEIGARRAAELARQMLAYTGKGSPVIEPLDLHALVEEMVHLLEVSVSKKAIIKLDFCEDVPSIEADATQIRQVIMNLVVNASEAIGDRSGFITIRTGALDCDRHYLKETYLDDDLADGAYAYLEVADTGCGMAAETVARIFEPFFSTKFTGRGLGLAAVLGIVRGHRGAIKITSTPGRGTTFRVLFPATTMDMSKNKTQADASKPGSLEGRVTLLVDDDDTVRAVAQRVLQRFGARVVTAENGRQAVDHFSADPDAFDCVILDLAMPVLDGEQTFVELQQIRPDVRVVLCSGYNETELVQRFAERGLAGILQKPYSPQRLCDAVLKALETKP